MRVERRGEAGIAVVPEGKLDQRDGGSRRKHPTARRLRRDAPGIRNPGGGLAIDPKTGQLWCSVNERDAIGDNLVPDYITHVQAGGFYGWPWWYMGGHQDPRHKGKHPELKDKVLTPDILLQPHNASLQIAFYTGTQFPAEYQGDIFASEHGSWNKTTRVGYEVIRIPLHQTGKATGEYQDFLTGFVTDTGEVWGRPVGATVARDGSLLVTDDGSKSIWRVSYTGAAAKKQSLTACARVSVFIVCCFGFSFTLSFQATGAGSTWSPLNRTRNPSAVF